MSKILSTYITIRRVSSAINDMEEEMTILREENNRLLAEAAKNVIAINDMREEIDLLKGKDNKRKREASEDVDDEETPEKECVHCKKTKPLSSFQVKTKSKNKAGHTIEYTSHRKLCHACHSSKYRDNKKAKVSK